MFNLINKSYLKTTANITSTGEKTECFPHKNKNEAKISTLITPI